ncbi:glycosyltransferase family 9 protein [Synechococcus sp. PCC 6312]|uniref:glycosyltransferase family 9 protein n=1 Tax=Synechococcus sp. (strain ATCC 27167 / PCC 6312) TaxID=195253 RepID=UPI00029EE818|nr:glycosyltransferase family 9 protein [Synechococcus sp. PCC 6312]AFY60942.1 ADP-heptose:LPS heptosyltransferase [Synechococcus sp. PCC 6312]
MASQRIVMLIPGGIGDQILIFPTLADLRGHYPQAEIDVVVEPRSQAAYEVNAVVNQVLTFPFRAKKTWRDWWGLIQQIRSRQYDIIVSLGESFAVRVLLWLTGVPKRVGYANQKTWGLLTHPAPLNKNQYAAAMYHDLLKGLGIDREYPPLVATVKQKDQAWGESERLRLQVQSPYILIHGGSSKMARLKGINKIYPIQAWLEVLHTLNAKYPGISVLIVQGPDDQEWGEQLTAAIPELKRTQPPSFGKLAALIETATGMICTDSGPMHLGVALNTPLVALFGPTDPQKLLPPQPHFRPVKSPTGQIGDISPAMILAEVVEVLHG